MHFTIKHFIYNFNYYFDNYVPAEERRKRKNEYARLTRKPKNRQRSTSKHAKVYNPPTEMSKEELSQWRGKFDDLYAYILGMSHSLLKHFMFKSWKGIRGTESGDELEGVQKRRCGGNWKTLRKAHQNMQRFIIHPRR